MADGRMTPEEDGISALFGDTPAPAVAPAFPTRRSLREARESAEAAVVEPVEVAPVATSVATSFDFFPAQPVQPSQAAQQTAPDATPLSRRELRAAQSSVGSPRRASRAAAPAAAKAPITRPAATKPQYKSPKKRASALVTMAAVAGLFATAGLPAYAFGSLDTAGEAKQRAAAETLSVEVPDTAVMAIAERGNFKATTALDLVERQSNPAMVANYEAYERSGAREAGDDYPWPAELSNNQGGGLSPLNYFYRECVDFVAWRLNRDAGSTSAPFKYDWSYLTPSGGNAYQWKSAWENHGWATGTTPKVGSVAWFGYHVAYVKSVNKGGTVTIEEYNHASDHIYGQRTIPATDVTTYLYAPPR